MHRGKQENFTREALDVTGTKFSGTVDGPSCSDYALHEVQSIKIYKRRRGGKSDTESLKRRKMLDSLVNSLEPKEEGDSSLCTARNKRKISALDNSDQTPVLGCLGNNSETEVVAGSEILVNVMEGIKVDNPLSVCSDIEHTSGVITNGTEEAGIFSSEQFEESITVFTDGNASGDVSSEHPPAESLYQRKQSTMEDLTTSLTDSNEIGDNVAEVIDQENHTMLLSHERALGVYFRKKLLVLDINGLIVDIASETIDGYEPDAIIGRKSVFKRRFCDEFLQFCFERYNVGVWTSRTKRNVQQVLDFVMGKTQKKLLFCWDQSHCTDTGFNTLENTDKPLFLKELKKLWEKEEPKLPWEKGEYDESNTLLLDDSPYKALCNPPNTAIFPRTYRYTDEKDNALGPGGDLRVYLEGLALAANVQTYVEQNPYGQPSITNACSSWDFYEKVLATLSSQSEGNADKSAAEHANAEKEINIYLDELKETPNKGWSATCVASTGFAGQTSGKNAFCAAEHKHEEYADSLRRKGKHPKTEETISSLAHNTTQVLYKVNHPPPMLQPPRGRPYTGFRKKLLVIDVHELLAVMVPFGNDVYNADAVFADRAVFKRPYCDDFLQFCFERFNVGIWSSRHRETMEPVLDFLFGNRRHNLLFSWHLPQCTYTGYGTVENRERTIVLKELIKLWEKHDRNLPWGRGEYNESNTLLVDVHPHKALCNPPYTAIFPHAYRRQHENDDSLGPRGDLRVYLEGLAFADNVQKYVEANPFGERAITRENLSWEYYLKVIKAISYQRQYRANNFLAYPFQPRRLYH